MYVNDNLLKKRKYRLSKIILKYWEYLPKMQSLKITLAKKLSVIQILKKLHISFECYSELEYGKIGAYIKFFISIICIEKITVINV